MAEPRRLLGPEEAALEALLPRLMILQHRCDHGRELSQVVYRLLAASVIVYAVGMFDSHRSARCVFTPYATLDTILDSRFRSGRTITNTSTATKRASPSASGAYRGCINSRLKCISTASHHGRTDWRQCCVTSQVKSAGQLRQSIVQRRPWLKHPVRISVHTQSRRPAHGFELVSHRQGMMIMIFMQHFLDMLYATRRRGEASL
jgi:hypothetical protein